MNEALKKELLNTQRTLGWMDLVIANIADCVCVVDQKGKILFANDAFAALGGKQRIFILGLCITDILDLVSSKGDLSERIKSDPKYFWKSSSIDGMYELSRGDKKHYLKITSNYLKTLKQTVLLIQDVTGEEELNKMRRSFIALASHQLRTPLTVINTYVYMLRDGYGGTLTKGQRKFTDNIIGGAKQMLELINTLLNTGSIEEGNISLEIKELKIEKVIEKVLSDISPRFKPKSITVEFIKPPKTPPIYSDSSHLHEIFSNLLINAIQYSEANGRIIIRLLVIEEDQNIIVSIRDDGIGIPEESQQQVFTPFHRADNAVLHFPDGTGLGLYLVKLLVRELSGEISFKSVENKGTTFYVTLPILG